jgi:energy-coupling factor transport system substrate-specific component
MKTKTRLDLRHLIIFPMFAAILFCSKQLLEALPNVELVSTLTMVYTLVYRKWALIPIYLYALLQGIFWGFPLWWVPYLYVWTVLWSITMLLPKELPLRWGVPVYAGVCALFGMAYGTLWAPFHILAYANGDWNKMLPWIITGLPWDLTHALGNLGLGLLIVPLTTLLRSLEARTQRQ